MRASSARRLLPVLALSLAAAILAGCGGSQPSASADAKPRAWVRVTEAEIRPGDEVPAPSGRVVLRITGGTVHNAGRRLDLDLATLDRLGTVEYTVFDRQAEGRNVTFSGPLLRTVLAVAGAEGRTLHTVALNDYAVDIPARDATTFPVLLATRADGKRMSVQHYGPTRVIYPTKGFQLDKTVYDPRWIWQLTAIDVR